MKIDPRFCSFYYENIQELPDIQLELDKTALLIVDMQKHFVAKDGPDAQQCREAGEWERWSYFFDRVEETVIPNTQRLLACCRECGVEVTFGRIACLKRAPWKDTILRPISISSAPRFFNSSARTSSSP